MKRIIPYIISFSTIFFMACKKFVTVPPPQNQLVSSTVFADESTATSAVVGIYSKIMGDGGPLLLSGLATFYPGLSSDELITTRQDLKPFESNSLTPGSPALLTIWDNGYQYIFDCNAVLEGLSKNPNISNPVKNQLTGEVKFLRALANFYLLNLFGDIPLIESTDYTVTKEQSRTKVAAIYSALIQDLNDAENLLPDAYPTDERVRANKSVATALLARVYLFTQDWNKAEEKSSTIIDNTTFRLCMADSVFLRNSPEAILQFIPVNLGYTWEAYLIKPGASSSIPVFQLTDGLISTFDSSDLRMSNWIGISNVQGTQYYYPAKYKSTSSKSFLEYYMVLRLGEQFLIRAEARAHLNNLPGSEDDLNNLRTRAGIPPVTTASQDSLLLAIEQERRFELFSEWGHRWFDLKRTGRAGVVLSMTKPSWSSAAELYPIPLIEVQNNPALTQNPGY